LADVEIYTKDNCQRDDSFNSFVNKYLKESKAAKYSINISTEEFDISFDKNPSYISDIDNDSIDNDEDNCVYKSNSDQKDMD